jgi:hypothetical protein
MNKDNNPEFPLEKENYIIMIVGLILVFVGYLLMSGGGSENPYDFNPEVFSFRRITLAPITALAGYAVVLYAIIKKPKA